MITLKVTGISEIIEEIQNLIDNTKKESLERVSNSLLKEIKEATPIDTGRARNGWQLEKDYKGNSIVNDVPYIPSLNDGHSKQAPSYFIERTVLKNKEVVPVGSIVTYR